MEGKSILKKVICSAAVVLALTLMSGVSETAFNGFVLMASAESEPTTVASGNCGDNVTWTLNSEGTFTISGTGAMGGYNGEVTPWNDYRGQITTVIIGDGVTSISSYAFTNCSELTSVTIPSSVKNIGNSAFYDCSKLATVTFDGESNLTSIDEYAFCGCSELASFTIPAKVETIGDSAFRESGITSVTIPSSVETIDKMAFYYCASLETVTFDGESNLTSIGSEAFSCCDKLASFTIPAKVGTIGDSAFYGCTNLATVTFDEESNLTSIGNMAFRDSGLTSVAIPSSVETIGEMAFYYCTNLATVTFDGESNLKSIGNEAFIDSGLTSVTIPLSVTSVGTDAFDYDVTLNAPCSWNENKLYDSADNIIIAPHNSANGQCTVCGTRSGSCGENAVWAYNESTKTLIISGTGAMADYSSESAPWNGIIGDVTKINIENGITSISSNAFSGCTALTSLTIPLSVETIGENAFTGISATATVNAPCDWNTNNRGVTFADTVTILTDEHEFQYGSLLNEISVTCLKCKGKGTVTLNAPNSIYNGSPYNGTVEIIFGGLLEGETPPEYSYVDLDSAPTDAGTYYVRIEYGGLSAKDEFTITPYNITAENSLAVELEYTSKVYDGSAFEPEITSILHGEKPLIKDTDYTVEYSDNVNLGNGVVSIIGKGNYTGTHKKYFAITKASPAYTAPKANELAYSGKSQALVTAGEVEVGESAFEYKLGDGEWSTNIPTATEAGTYTVYYRLEESENYEAVAETPIQVTILEFITIDASTLTPGTSGIGWRYTNSKWLYLNEKLYFKIINDTSDISAINNDGIILDGTFDSKYLYFNRGSSIEGGTVNSRVFVYSGAEIKGGTFNGIVEPQTGGKISGGTFTQTSTIKSVGTINSPDVTFEGTVYSYDGGKIVNGTFNGTVYNGVDSDGYSGYSSAATISGGTFNGTVNNSEKGTITGGTYGETTTVSNNGGTIEAATTTFGGTIFNYNKGEIKNGTFSGNVYNGFDGGDVSDGTISGGTFSNYVTNYSTISGGTYGENTTVSNNNGGTISGGSFDMSCRIDNDGGIIDAATVTFGGTIFNYNKGEIKNGTFNNEVYNGSDGNSVSTATISGGTFNYSIENYSTISEGEFTANVLNCEYGTISGGKFSSVLYNSSGTINGTDVTFSDKVYNSNDGEIVNGIFNGTVYNGYNEYVISNATISGGTFTTLENYGTITITSNSVTVSDVTTVDNGTVTLNGEIHTHNSEDCEYSESETEGKHLVTKWCENCPIKYAPVFETEEEHTCEWKEEHIPGGIFESKNTCPCGYVDETVTYTFKDGPFVYTGKAIDPVIITSDKSTDRTDTIYYVNPSTNEPIDETPKDVGVYTVKMKLCPGCQYTVIIEPYDITDVTFTQVGELTYDGESKTPEFTATIDLGGEQHELVKGTEYTFAAAETTAGTYEVEIIGTGNFTGTATATWEIKAVSPTFTAPTALNIPLSYMGQPQALVNAGTATIGGTMYYSLTGEENSYTFTEVPTGTDAGDYTVYWMVKGGENYSDVVYEEPIKVNIAKVDSAFVTAPEANILTFTGFELTLVTKGETKDGTIQYSTNGTMYSDTVPAGKDAGSYTVYYKILGDKNHNDKTFGPVTVIIQKAAPEVNVPTAINTITYGDKLSAVTLSDDTWTWVNGETIPTVINNGYEAVVKVDDKNYNYVGIDGYNSTDSTVTKTITVTVNKADVTVTADEQHIAVGDSIPSPTYRVTGLADGDTLIKEPTIGYSGVDSMTVALEEGEYEIIVEGGEANSDNYNDVKHVNSKLIVSDCNHKGTTEKRFDGTNHWFYCTKCGKDNIGSEAHYGGTADCMNQAVCEDCGEKYGNTDITNHGNNTSKDLTSDGEYHWYECACGADINKTAHSGGKATCMEKAKCEICLAEYGDLNSANHSNVSTILTSDGGYHWYECACGADINKTAHSGGTATCTAKAKCEACSTEYGDYAKHAADTSKWSSDETKHWHECTCGLNMDAAEHTSDGGKVTTPVTETTDGVKTYTCTVCGYVIKTEIIPATGTNTPAQTTPSTGEDKPTETTPSTGGDVPAQTTPSTTPPYTGIPSWVTIPTGPITTTTTTTTTTAPVDEEIEEDADSDTEADEDTDTVKPADKKQPQIKGEDGKTGWEAIEDEIAKAKDGGKIAVDMNGATEVPKDIFKKIKGKDIDLVIELENGFTWTINGEDVTNAMDIDLGVNEGSAIPVKIINEVTGECEYVTISLSHNGDFGFTATLTVDMGEENEGYYANLYWYTDGDTEFICADKINSKGKADLKFTHASEYVIVIDEESHGKRAEVSEDNEETDGDVDGDTIITDEDDDVNPPTGIVISFTGVIISAAAVMLAKKKKIR